MATSNGSTALNVKLRAMYGKRLTPQNYKELMRKQNVAEIAAYLKQQPSYISGLRDINENTVHRGQLEHVIRSQLMIDYSKTFAYVNIGDMNFFSFFLKRMEIDQILSCVRFLFTNESGEYFISLPKFFMNHSKVDFQALAKVKSYEDLLSVLKDTAYYAILKNFDLKSQDKSDMIKIENEFDRLYYSNIYSFIRKEFSGPVADQIRTSFGIEADMKNISQVYRLKKYFNMKGDQIKPLLLPYHKKVKTSDLYRMADAPDLDSAMQIFSETSYGKEFDPDKKDYIEHFFQTIKFEANKRLLAFSTSSHVSIISYLQLKRQEIDNIVSIIEGVRYGLSSSEISEVLVGITA